MTGAMYAAVSGLRTHMDAMSVIGNNVANVNTAGYKATRMTFNEALYMTKRNGSDGNDQLGGVNPAQIGFGCSVGTIDLDMSTKNYSPTGRGLDCMIDGDGFYILGDNKEMTGITKQAELQGMKLSRLGNFQFDSNGYLVDGNGSIVYGFLRMTSYDEYTDGMTDEEKDAVEEENLTSPVLTPIRLPMCYIGANTPEETPDGETQVINKTRTYLIWPQYDTANRSVEDGDVESWRETHEEEAESIPEGAVAQRLQPNTVSIDKTGCITAMTKDEQLVVVGYIAIGAVDNPNGVTHTDGRYFHALGGAGQIHLGTVGGSFTYIPPNGDNAAQGGAGDGEGINLGTSDLTVEPSGDTELVPGGLESSGTDLAEEITNMIVIQRGYQANTRIVTVTDSMLEELVNMKR